MKNYMQIVFLIVVLLVVSYSTAFAMGDAVEAIVVQIDAKSVAHPLPARIAKRMSASVQTIGESVLSGQNITQVTDRQEAYETLIQEVFDRILIGYSVDRIVIVPAATTRISAVVIPWGEVVSKVVVELDTGNVPPAVAALICQDVGDVEMQIADVLTGLPVDAVDWAGNISKTMVRDLLAVRLPEFRPNLEITPGERTIVRLSVVPQGKTIQNVQTTLYSQSIPNLLLLRAREQVGKTAGVLTGLPVAFVERHKPYFTDHLQIAVADQAVVKRYGLTVAPLLQIASATEVNVSVETNKFNVKLEGYLDFGRQEDGSAVRLHIGKYISAKDELFLQTHFVPRTVSWQVMPGWGRQFSSATSGGLKYELNHRQEIFWLNQKLGNHWQLRLERTPAEHLTEFAVRYKIHEFLSAEYVFNNDENWFRLVGNL